MIVSPTLGHHTPNFCSGNNLSIGSIISIIGIFRSKLHFLREKFVNFSTNSNPNPEKRGVKERCLITLEGTQ